MFLLTMYNTTFKNGKTFFKDLNCATYFLDGFTDTHFS